MQELIKLYLEFLKNEQEYIEEDLKNIEKEIINNPNKNFGLISTTDMEEVRVLEVNINFKDKKLLYYVDNKIIEIEKYSLEEIKEVLKYVHYDDLKGYVQILADL